MTGQHWENYDVKRETVHCYPRNVDHCCTRLDFRRSLVPGLPSPRVWARSAGSFPEQRLVIEPTVARDRWNLSAVFKFCFSLRSKRFREAKSEERGFRRFAREKNGARAKNRKEGVVECRNTIILLVYIFD